LPACFEALAASHSGGPARGRFSAEQIAGTLAAVHPDNPMLQAFHETIYTAIYAKPRGELRTEVIGWLRFGHVKRCPRARGDDLRVWRCAITSHLVGVFCLH